MNSQLTVRGTVCFFRRPHFLNCVSYCDLLLTCQSQYGEGKFICLRLSEAFSGHELCDILQSLIVLDVKLLDLCPVGIPAVVGHGQ